MKKQKRGIFMYRDGNNYKFLFEADVPKYMRVGAETTYNKLGYTRKSFHRDVIGYKYDKESDHNIVTLESII